MTACWWTHCGKNTHVYGMSFCKNAYCAWWDSDAEMERKTIAKPVIAYQPTCPVVLFVLSLPWEYSWSNRGTTVFHLQCLLSISRKSALSSGTTGLVKTEFWESILLLVILLNRAIISRCLPGNPYRLQGKQDTVISTFPRRSGAPLSLASVE